MYRRGLLNGRPRFGKGAEATGAAAMEGAALTREAREKKATMAKRRVIGWIMVSAM